VACRGARPLRFQWFRDGQPIAGATNSIHSLTAVPTGDCGAVFSVAVTNTVLGISYPVVSANALLQVVPCGPPQPVLVKASREALGGALLLEFNGESGAGYTVLGTTNLPGIWSVLGPAVEASPGLFRFTDSAATNRLQMFYRLRQP